MSEQRRTAISYTRFSNPSQASGDSEDRQQEMFERFCQRHNLTPLRDVFRDRGRSGYSGAHRTKGELGRLVEESKIGRFESGSVIVAESWDRLGRLRPDLQIELLKELLVTGVDIGICRLDDVFTLADFGSHKWTTLAVFTQLAYQESRQKADRLKHSWESKRARARDKGELLSARVPAWLEVVNGVIRPIPDRAALVQRMFQLAAEGHGTKRIVRLLTAEGVATFTGRGEWTTTYISRILTDERATGRFQPRHTDDTPSGPVLEGYYPAVVDADLFALAEAARRGRHRQKKERDNKHVNVFQSLLQDPRDGSFFHLFNRNRKDRHTNAVLMNGAGANGRTRTYTLPYHVVEAAVLSLLREIDVATVLPKKAGEDQDALAVLRAKLGNVRSELASLQEELRAGFSKRLAAVLRERETEEVSLAGQLQDALAKSLRPLEREWSGLPGLMDAVKQDGDAARLRIKLALRRIVESAQLLIVPRGGYALAAVQMVFTGGTVRHYLIVYKAARNHVSGGAWCDSWKFPTADLRKPADARKVEAGLLAEDVEALAALLRPLDNRDE